ncbi:MAG: TIGR04282 family arsenosugar biosynthesis glycosyltransferase [Methylococcaceae bacterium]|jgi:hypothetical protein
MAYRYPNIVLMIFCKAPVPGQVKTRLIDALSPEQAAALHIELSERTLTLAVQHQLCPIELWCAPNVDHPFFAHAVTNFGVTLKQQQGLGLGERLNHAFETATPQYDGAIAIGCDCPSLDEHVLTAALEALSQNQQCVIAPAEDGGYVLIGLSQPQPELFKGITWGGPQVLQQSQDKIALLGLNYCELPQQWDLDTPADLKRYRDL